jgi:hypothetical protein
MGDIDKEIFKAFFMNTTHEYIQDAIAAIKIYNMKNPSTNRTADIISYIRFRGNARRQMEKKQFFKLTHEDKLYIKANLKAYPILPKQQTKTQISGPYSKIFYSETDNNKVAESCSEITNALNSNKPVFVVGYGASGAGKTSTLINYRDTTSGNSASGIIIFIIRNVTNIKSIVLDIHEFYQPTSTSKGTIHSLDAPLTFDNDLKLQLNNETITPKTKVSPYVGEAVTLQKNDPLDDCIVKLMDEPNTRRIAATTNNPQSSRSHVLIHLKINRNQEDTTHLFIADYAGVENKFKCDSLDELVKFANIKNRTEDNLFYDKDSIESDYKICKKYTKQISSKLVKVILPNDSNNQKELLEILQPTIKDETLLTEELVKIQVDKFEEFEGVINKYKDAAETAYNNSSDISKKLTIYTTLDIIFTKMNTWLENGYIDSNQNKFTKVDETFKTLF